MAIARWTALTLLALPLGCQGPGYSPYGAPGYGSPYGGGYGGQPYMQPYGTPIQTMTPGPSYVPNGAPAGGLQPQADPYRGGTFSNPGSSTSLGPVPEPNGGAAPMYSPPAGGGNISVPFPNEPSAFQAPVQRNTLGGDLLSEPAPMANNPALQPASGSSSPWSNGGGIARPSNPLAEEMLGDDLRPIKANKPVATGAESRPFAYDADGYKWMRGMVSYEKREKSWSLVYSDAPDAGDELAGCVTIADHPELTGLQDGEIVLVSGEFSGAEQDHRGKPVYVASKIERQSPARTADAP